MPVTKPPPKTTTLFHRYGWVVRGLVPAFAGAGDDGDAPEGAGAVAVVGGGGAAHETPNAAIANRGPMRVVMKAF
jgi:hypothetical protein